MSKIKRKILPDLEKGDNGPHKAQLYTLPNVAAVIEWMGWTVRFDMMAFTPVITGDGVWHKQASQLAAMHAIEDNLRRVGISPANKLGASLATLGRLDPYHPMEEWFNLEWDGRDRIADLAATVTTESEMWPIYLRRWLIQTVEAAAGWRDCDERSLPYCLVFAGPQGIGKTQWFKRLAPGFVRTEAELHLSKSDAKDHKLDVLRFPIVELSEIDATFGASNISSLKTFLSAGRDVIRAPFQANALERIRSSVFGGSVNDAQFIIDTTGSRRFWPVQAEAINWEHDIDMRQLYSQAYTLWETEAYFLNAEEEALSVKESLAFKAISPAVEKIAGHYADTCEEWDMYAVLNISQICDVTRASDHPGAMSGIRMWLREHLGKERTLENKQRAWAFPIGREHAHLARNARILSETEAKRLTAWN